MGIMYTVDSVTVDRDEFRSRIGETGYFELPQEERTWVHIGRDHQIIIAKTMHGSDGKMHTFRVSIDT